MKDLTLADFGPTKYELQKRFEVEPGLNVNIDLLILFQK